MQKAGKTIPFSFSETVKEEKKSFLLINIIVYEIRIDSINLIIILINIIVQCHW